MREVLLKSALGQKRIRKLKQKSLIKKRIFQDSLKTPRGYYLLQ